MMLRALGHWYRNGGKVTHDYWKRIRKNLRQEIVEYLHNLPLQFDIEVNGTSYKLVHAAIAEEYQDCNIVIYFYHPES